MPKTRRWATSSYEGSPVSTLNAALQQTQWPGEVLTERTWREVVGSRLRVLAWDQVAADVRPFLEREEDAALLSMETALQLLTFTN